MQSSGSVLNVGAKAVDHAVISGNNVSSGPKEDELSGIMFEVRKRQRSESRVIREHRVWIFWIGLHRFPERERRKDFWNLIRRLADISPLPWCILGDFNDIMYVTDKKRSCSPSTELDEWIPQYY